MHHSYGKIELTNPKWSRGALPILERSPPTPALPRGAACVPVCVCVCVCRSHWAGGVLQQLEAAAHAHLLGKPGALGTRSSAREKQQSLLRPRVSSPCAPAALPSVLRWKDGFSLLEEKAGPVPSISLIAHPSVQGFRLIFIKQASGLVLAPRF